MIYELSNYDPKEGVASVDTPQQFHWYHLGFEDSLFDQVRPVRLEYKDIYNLGRKDAKANQSYINSMSNQEIVERIKETV